MEFPLVNQSLARGVRGQLGQVPALCPLPPQLCLKLCSAANKGSLCSSALPRVFRAVSEGAADQTVTDPHMQTQALLFLPPTLRGPPLPWVLWGKWNLWPPTQHPHLSRVTPSCAWQGLGRGATAEGLWPRTPPERACTPIWWAQRGFLSSPIRTLLPGAPQAGGGTCVIWLGL